MPPDHRINALHVAPHLQSLGGMQAVLRHHWAHDQEADIESRLAVLFERQTRNPEKADALGWNWRWTIPQMGRAFEQLMRRYPGRLCVYHNLWGLPFLASGDRASRRIGFLHSSTPRLEAELLAQRGLLDGLIAVSPAQSSLAHKCLPELGADRIRLLPLPIDPPKIEPARGVLENRPIVLGYSGRLVKDIKRVDRLPELTRQLSQRGVRYRLELLGDGADGTWLRKQLAGNPAVVFHGIQSGAAYWKLLAGWDLMLYVSDSEGTPVSLLEGLSMGVAPLFPRLASGGTAYTQKVDERLIYDAGDMGAAANTIQALAQMPAAKWELWRRRCVDAVRNHLGSAYIHAFRDFLEAIEKAPRQSASVFETRPFYATDRLPLGLLSRLTPDALLKKTPFSVVTAKS